MFFSLIFADVKIRHPRITTKGGGDVHFQSKLLEIKNFFFILNFV